MLKYSNVVLLSIIYLHFSYSYVIMSDINGRLCNIDFSTYYLDFNYTSNNDIVKLPLNLYQPNYQSIINTSWLWWEPNLPISHSSIATNPITVDVELVELDNSMIANTERQCEHNKLIYSKIQMNSNECYYLDNGLYHLLSNYNYIIPIIIVINVMYPICLYTYYNLELTFNTNMLLMIINLVFNATLFIYLILHLKKCYSFHSVLAHEMGHILGLTHPDEHSYFNKDSPEQINKNYQNSIMLSNNLLLNNFNCIQLDDNKGIYHLYDSSNNLHINDNIICQSPDKLEIIVVISIIMVSIIPLVTLSIIHLYKKRTRELVYIY